MHEKTTGDDENLSATPIYGVQFALKLMGATASCEAPAGCCFAVSTSSSFAVLRSASSADGGRLGYIRVSSSCVTPNKAPKMLGTLQLRGEGGITNIRDIASI